MIGRFWQIFSMIHVQEPKIWQNNTTKINEFRQITRLLDIILLAKAAHHQIWHLGETHWWFQKGMTNLVLWKFSQSLENNGTKILKIRASLFLSCTVNFVSRCDPHGRFTIVLTIQGEPRTRARRVIQRVTKLSHIACSTIYPDLLCNPTFVSG